MAALDQSSSGIDFPESRPDDLRRSFHQLYSHSAVVTSLALQWRRLQSQFDSVEASMALRFADLESREKQLEDRLRELESQENQLESKENHGFDGSMRARLKAEPVEDSSAILPLYVTMDVKQLREFLNEHLNDHGAIRDHVSAALRISSEPAKLVLDAMEGLYGENKGDGRAVGECCVLLLEQLWKVSPRISASVREEAARVAGRWKKRMGIEKGGEDSLEVLGFLKLVATYKLVSDFDGDEIARLFDTVAKRRRTPELRCALRIAVKIPENSQLIGTVGSKTVSRPPDLISLCTRMDGEGLRFFLNEHVEEHDSMCDEVYDALRYASDPSKLVLIALRGFCQHKSKLVKGFDPEVNKKSCVLLLNQLIRASTKIEPHLKKEALDFAVGIKTNLDKRKTPLKVLGYLLIIYAFGLVSSLNLSAIDLFELLEFVVHCKQTPDICRALLADKIPEFIQHLVKNNRRTEAIRYIYEFELVDKFPPVPLLTVHLQSCEKLAKDFCSGGRYSRGAKNAATRTHIAGLRALIKCIAEYNIEFEQSPAYLEKRIMQVEKEQVFIKEKKKVPIKTKNEEVPIKKKKKNEADRKRPARAFDAVLISQLQRQSGNKRLRITESADPALSTSSGTIPNKHSIQPPSQQVVGLQAGQGAQNLSIPTECNGFRGSQHVPSHLKSSPSAHGFASPTHATSKTSPAATKCESGITSSAQSNSNAIPATVQCGPHNVSTCKNQHLHMATHAHVATMTSTGIFSTIGSNSHLSPPAMQCGHVNPSVSNTNPVVQYGSGIASEVSTCQNQHHPTVEHGIASKVSTCQNQHLQTVEHAYVGGLLPQVTPDLTQLAGSCLSTMSAPTVCEPIVHAPTVCAATNTSAGFTSGVQSIQSPPQQPGGVTMPQITPYLTPSAGCCSFGGSDPATSHLNSSATGSYGLRGSKSIPMDANIVASQFGYAGNCPSNMNFGQYDVPSQNMGTPRPYAPPPYAQHVLQNGTPSPYRHPPYPQEMLNIGTPVPHRPAPRPQTAPGSPSLLPQYHPFHN